MDKKSKLLSTVTLFTERKQGGPTELEDQNLNILFSNRPKRGPLLENLLLQKVRRKINSVIYK